MCLAATLGTRVGLSFPFRERFFSFHHWNELSFHIGIPALDTTISGLLVVVELRSFWELVLQLNNLIAFLTLDGWGVVGLRWVGVGSRGLGSLGRGGSDWRVLVWLVLVWTGFC